MAIPESRQAISEQKKSFAGLAKLLANLQSSSPQLSTLDTLSMGMSGDIEAAIIEGSTLVRVGERYLWPTTTPKVNKNQAYG